MQNAFVESFNDKMWAECLNVNWFTDLEDARLRIGTWRREYNEVRPHGSLGKVRRASIPGARGGGREQPHWTRWS
jgi:putative transposase